VDDWAIACRLDEDFDRLDFRGLLDRYFDLATEVPDDLRERQVHHILTAPARAVRWLEALGTGGATGPVLDLGCGSGSFLAAVGRIVEQPCGVDIAMRWLLVARKRLDEEGLHLVPLACACAESLPVADGQFAAVIAGDVIEHVSDQGKTLNEAHRVLQPLGRLFLASPNRYSLAPEPHVQVWGVGFLPRRWMKDYVQLARGVEFRAIRTMGYFEWSRLLRAGKFGGGRIEVPPLPRDDLAGFRPAKRTVARLYNAIVTTQWGQALARGLGPLFHIVCEKPEETTPRSSSRAIRRRSRPSRAPRRSAAPR
jgi:SAM-dependent methyltransferase